MWCKKHFRYLKIQCNYLTVIPECLKLPERCKASPCWFQIYVHQLVWDLVVLYAHIQIDKYRFLCRNEQTPTTLVYIRLTNEGQWDRVTAVLGPVMDGGGGLSWPHTEALTFIQLHKRRLNDWLNTPEKRGGQEREVIARKLARGEVQRDERK